MTEYITLYAQWKKESNGCNFTFKDIETNGAKDMIEEITHRCIVKGYPDALSDANDTIEHQLVVIIMIDRA